MSSTVNRSFLRPGKNCWRTAQADRFSFIIDAADYFAAARQAMLKAKQSIILIGWDFDARIDIGEAADGGPQRLGDFIYWLVEQNKSLQIRLLRWDTGALASLFRGTTALTLLRWKMHPRIVAKLDAVHPLGAAHHQKIVAIDDCFAFCGGIDMTADRWDTPEHKDNDPRRIGPGGDPYGPWHDATSAFDGEAARAIGELCRVRWKKATGENVAAADAGADCWPELLKPTLENIKICISRTIGKVKGARAIHEIEQAYVDLIGSAKHYIYAESQYFASRRIAAAIAARLREPNCPEIVIINPREASGWLEQTAMDTARARLVEGLRRLDRHDRLRIYYPRTQRGAPIYVHAKVMIVDDRYIKVGSSNFNNRSMRLDSECDVVAVAEGKGARSHSAAIAATRDRLLAEHLGVSEKRFANEFAATGSLIKTIETLRGNGRSLVPYRIPKLDDMEAWLAENQVLDPEGPDQMLEPFSKRSIFRGWDWKA